MVAGKLVPHYEEEAKKRQQEHGGTAPGRRSPETLEARLPQVNDAPVKPRKRRDQSRDQAGKAMNVSGRSVGDAVRALEDGVPELVEAVENGHVAVSTSSP